MCTLSVPEAADVLKVHPKTVLELINAGAIPAAKIGRAFVMLTSDVLIYVKDQATRQTAERIGIKAKSLQGRKLAGLRTA